MKKILSLTALVILLSAAAMQAQITAGASLTLGLPQGEFKDNLDRYGYGLTGEIFYTPGPIKVFGIGIDLTYMNYGSETRRAPFSNTIPDLTVDVDRSYNMISFHPVIRIYAPLPMLRPYLDLVAGGNYIFTTTTIRSRSSLFNKGEEVATDENFSDFAWNYGFGGGVLIDVMNEPGLKLSIDLRARYLYGTEAEYLKEGSVIVNAQNGTVTYNVSKSTTDMLFIQAGVAVALGL